MKQVDLKAYAKINIGLKILGKRPDGYHEIETIFQQVDLFDVIRIQSTSSSTIKISSNKSELPVNEQNICYKAVDLVRKKFGIKNGVEIEILKNIPIGAGLGGGSSNAAAVIRGLQKIWDVKLKSELLLKLAQKLGADVPFFLKGGTALGRGIGEILTPIHLPFKFYAVLVFPNTEISTNWAYKNFNFNLTKTKKIIKLSQISLNNYQLFELRNVINNDLEEVVFQKYPELLKIKNEFYECGACLANMSGSGSTIYGLFSKYENAVDAINRFPKSYQIFLTQPMT